MPPRALLVARCVDSPQPGDPALAFIAPLAQHSDPHLETASAVDSKNSAKRLRASALTGTLSAKMECFACTDLGLNPCADEPEDYTSRAGDVAVKAPSGKLGLLFEKIEQGDLGHVVAYVRDDSVLLGQVARGDAICKVDATVTLAMDHDAVRALITSRSGSERTLSVRKAAFKRGQDSWVLNA